MNSEAESGDDERWRPPGRFFNGVVVLVLLILLWAMSFPGADALLLFGAVPAILGLGLTWLARLVLWSNQPFRRRASMAWSVAPTAVALTAVLVLLSAPLRLRFEIDRAEFDAVIADIDRSASLDEWQTVRPEVDRIGTYSVSSIRVVGDNVIIYDTKGSFFDNAGFAHLPDGPDPALSTGWFESPQFRSLGDDWYSFVASW